MLPSNPSKSFIARNQHLYGKEAMQTDTRNTSNISVGLWAAVMTGARASGKANTRKSVEERLNKTERRWLSVLGERGYIPVFIQDVTLRLGDDCRYTPDFFTPDLGVYTFWEVKGFMRDDALVKLKVAARMHSWARFVLVKWDKQWIETEIQP